MKFGIIKERKNPPDKRVVFSPKKLEEFKNTYPEAIIKVESSEVRIFSNAEYEKVGVAVVDDISECDVLIGVKEVPLDALIPNKKYFFFSHTIKKADYNRKLLQEVLKKNIVLYDHETIMKENGARLIGFGRYAGIVGAYNGFRAFGLKNKTFSLSKAENLVDQKALIAELNTIELPNIKILLTGTGKVAFGAKEMLDAMNIKRVSVESYLNDAFDKAVYCLLDVLDYNKRIDGQILHRRDFYSYPENYTSDFMRFAKVTDFFIAGHFFGDGSPFLFTRDDVKSEDFNIKYVADVSCDIDGPVATTIRPSTIADPIYGYHAATESEIDFMDKDAIVVMAVDNLPSELPRDASEGFGELFLEHVIPAFYNDDKDGILSRAKMTNSDGTLADRYAYLQDYVDGKE